MDPITIALLAAGGGAIVNGAASIFGANKQADAAKAGMREQGRQFDLSRADMLGARGQMLRDLSPYKQAGTGALAQLQQAIMGGEVVRPPSRAYRIGRRASATFGVTSPIIALSRSSAACHVRSY